MEKGLSKEEVTFLSIIRGTSNEIRKKILQFFIEKKPTVSSLKVFADNLQASEAKLVLRPCTPLEFASWREKFEYWVAATWGQVQEDSALLGNELKQKLESDWI